MKTEWKIDFKLKLDETLGKNPSVENKKRSIQARMDAKIIGQGKWLSLHELRYQDGRGNEKSWECVRRTGGRGAAAIVATVMKEGAPHVVLVRQFRPPVDGWVLEFPAGLVDADEAVGTTAQRELAEETGWRGEAIEVGPAVYNSPGMSDERTALVRIAASRQEKTNLEDDEAIEIVTLPLRGLKARLLEEAENGTQLDAKLWCFAVGMEVGSGGSI